MNLKKKVNIHLECPEKSPELSTFTVEIGLSLTKSLFSTIFTTRMPWTTLPNTTYLSSRNGSGAFVVM